MMKRLVFSTALLAASLAGRAHADTYSFTFSGAGVSGDIVLTYGTATDATYSNAFEVTGISGTFTDTNLGIVDAVIGSLVPVVPAVPETGNTLPPHDFSRFAVANGLPPENHGTLSYDNLFWPGGSPHTASDYPLYGGIFDIYGLLFDIGDGRYVNLWSNGDFFGTGKGAIYGVAVVTTENKLDYVGGVSIVPEPSTLVLVSIGMFGALAWRRDPLKGRVSL